MKKIITLALFVFAVSVFSQEKEVSVVLLAGQSNMAGGGNFDELGADIKDRIKKVSSRVFLSDNGKEAVPLTYRKNKPTEKYNFTKRFGPEIFIGLTLAEKYPNQEFLLIKRSQGGTSLYGAWNPDWNAEKAKALEKGEYKQNLKLYSLHIEDIKTNLGLLKSKGKSYKIYGLAWMQGENDAIDEASVKSYKNNLRKLITSYRKDLDVREMPMVLGQINSRYGIAGGADKVRLAMVKFTNQDYYSSLIKTSKDTTWNDFPKHTDNVHYNTDGQKRLGIAFVKGFDSVYKKLDVNLFQGMESLENNEITRIKAIGETNMIYNVFTPSNFSKSKLSPIIIVFSPSGNGMGMLNKMKASAEKYGWVLVGCDKLKNGMKDVELEKQMEDEVLNDVFKNIPHDKDKIYLGGFSGGAMRAYNLTTWRKEKIAGIIAYGGWLGGKEYQDKRFQHGMKVAMINGINDTGANHWNEIDAKTLEKLDCTVKLFRHSGGHQVAPTKVTNEVIEWLIR